MMAIDCTSANDSSVVFDLEHRYLPLRIERVKLGLMLLPALTHQVHGRVFERQSLEPSAMRTR